MAAQEAPGQCRTWLSSISVDTTHIVMNFLQDEHVGDLSLSDYRTLAKTTPDYSPYRTSSTLFKVPDRIEHASA